ncbi:MAG: acyl carrier protein [Gammaproteobacteria bacterium]|nr:acyl carrier protein [Gammaproteobacteria bacterium]
MNNHQKLKDLLLDVFLIGESEYSLEISQEDIETWDSMGLVAMAVGIEETFGHHLTQEEALSIRKFQDIVDILSTKGMSFDD